MKIIIFRQAKVLIYLCQFLLIAILAIACHRTTITTSKDTKGCVHNYNHNIDYFPDKVTINYATGFDVEYHKNYKLVTVKNPWQNAKTGFQYILVQCGTPAPKNFQSSQIITVPINTVVSLSTTHLPHFAKLGLVDKLIGVSNTKRVNTPEVIQKIKAGKVAEVGNSESINIEKILELNPDLIMTYGVGNPQIDSHHKLIEAGLKVAINAEYMETSPLGHAEWLKFTALFFNQENIAQKTFNQISTKYENIASKTKSVKNRPTVFTGFNFKGVWYIPGCQSYVAKYLADAGSNYLCADNSSGSKPLSFENVFQRAASADYWLNLSQSWQSLKDVISEDNRYANFAAVKTGNVYNNNARVNNSGGNDYWESGTSNPDIVLSDLIKILHPEILPNHQLVYYRKLEK
ncbi:ABC-type transporter, periplasmic subunit [Fischerella thermalis JSC-11]|uniref:ABC-type transporter, periplasmic subunit n=1 Tax=Fischerella thermalis JSC-11 TaxID=741277 RepID=G6FUJ4_9CYAN|nr:ABC transporter substrate-binding protein [Fischerella thermalis]EHC12924.1 ABC-type transporter, periplasmic subunit [Fischerella thermalis JSC-11]